MKKLQQLDLALFQEFEVKKLAQSMGGGTTQPCTQATNDSNGNADTTTLTQDDNGNVVHPDENIIGVSIKSKRDGM